MDRRTFIAKSTTAVAGMGLLSTMALCNSGNTPTPPHLVAYRDHYATDPRQASLAWFASAGYGLFMHYGLYSIWGRGAWVQLLEKIPLSQYVKLTDESTAEKFDADFITDLAIERNLLSHVGKSPASVAEQVLDAVRTNRFWILTHDEWGDVMRQRTEAMVTTGALTGRAPEEARRG